MVLTSLERYGVVAGDRSCVVGTLARREREGGVGSMVPLGSVEDFVAGRYGFRIVALLPGSPLRPCLAKETGFGAAKEPSGFMLCSRKSRPGAVAGAMAYAELSC